MFSLSRTATFDLGRYPRNTSKARTFTKPGVMKVFCHLHSHMSAIVRVFSHPYFATPDRNGRFTIPDVPAGPSRGYGLARAGRRSDPDGHHRRSGTTELTFSLPLTDPE